VEQRIYSIKELNRYIRMKLESDNVLSEVWIRGEISNFTHHSSGHMYFTLKDADSRIKTIMFASHNQRLPFIPKEGTRVIAKGNVSVYERDGQYQFYVTQMQPDGVGSLYLAYEQLKSKLESAGWFLPERKKAIPRFPKVIGVVTSPTGAAVRDIITTLERRYPRANVILYPVLVQGKGAAPSIVKAIKALNESAEADVLIVGRGGGSLEELWAFNEEIVAHAIYHSSIPVISAVGHETDFTIADFVADLRAATPTAAAELAVPHQAELMAVIKQRQNMLYRLVQSKVEQAQLSLKRVQRSPVLVHPKRSLTQHIERLDALQTRSKYLIRNYISLQTSRHSQIHHQLLRYHPAQTFMNLKRRHTELTRQLGQGIERIMREHKQRLGGSIRHLDALSPLKVMERGYSLVYDQQEEKLIKSVGDVHLGDLITVKVADGDLSCQVWGMEPKLNEKGEDNGTRD
jgi:exodeoxyribonuclease VII large subunit